MQSNSICIVTVFVLSGNRMTDFLSFAKKEICDADLPEERDL